jgi:hypothetical protein
MVTKTFAGVICDRSRTPAREQGGGRKQPLSHQVLDAQRADRDRDAVQLQIRYGLAHQQGNGTFVSVLNKAVNDQGIDTLRVRLTAPPTSPTTRYPYRPAPLQRPLSTFSATGTSRGC